MNIFTKFLTDKALNVNILSQYSSVGQSRRTCLASGEWDVAPPSCVAAPCAAHPPSVQHAKMQTLSPSSVSYR